MPERRRAPVSDEPLRVLVTDDDPDYRAWVVSLIHRLGFVVDSADNGASAIDQLTRAGYDIVVVDMEMPRMNGIDVIRRLRSEPMMKDTYAIMLTARDEVEVKLHALDTGFDDYVIKTASEPELVSKLAVARRIATRQRSRDVAARELYGLATRDELTGVFNRRFFAEETKRLLAERETVSVILFDLDDFKGVNDTYGHLAGDRVLRDVGALFQRSTRSVDLIARFGGDEFVMVIADLAVTEVEAIAARLSRDVSALQWTAGGEPFSIGATPGVASSKLLEQPSIEQLLTVADRDLYKNKWLRKHPGAPVIPEESSKKETRIDLVLPLPTAIREVSQSTAASDGPGKSTHRPSSRAAGA